MNPVALEHGALDHGDRTGNFQGGAGGAEEGFGRALGDDPNGIFDGFLDGEFFQFFNFAFLGEKGRLGKNNAQSYECGCDLSHVLIAVRLFCEQN